MTPPRLGPFDKLRTGLGWGGWIDGLIHRIIEPLKTRLGLGLAPPRLGPFDLGLLRKSPLRAGLGWGLCTRPWLGGELRLELHPTPRLGLAWELGLGWGGFTRNGSPRPCVSPSVCDCY